MSKTHFFFILGVFKTFYFLIVKSWSGAGKNFGLRQGGGIICAPLTGGQVLFSTPKSTPIWTSSDLVESPPIWTFSDLVEKVQIMYEKYARKSPPIWTFFTKKFILLEKRTRKKSTIWTFL